MRRERREFRFHLYPYPGWLDDPMVYRARVNVSGRSLMAIPVTEESGTPPHENQVVYVGSAPGQWDVAVLRARSYSSGQLLVSENEVDWNTSLYVTAPLLFAPMYRPQVVQDVGGIPTVWKDTDIAFSDLYHLPPKANLSLSRRWCPVDEEVQATVTGLAMRAGRSISSASVAVLAPPGTYTPVPGGYQLNAERLYWIRGAVTDSAGVSRWMVLPVFCGDAGSVRRFTLESFSGDDRGWHLTVSFPLDDATPPDISPFPNWTLAVFYSDIVEFVGWLTEDSLQIDWNAGIATVTAHSALATLDRLRGFAYLIEDSSAPASWYQVHNLTAARAAHFHLEWASTFNCVCATSFGTHMDRYLKAQSFHEGSLQRQLIEDLIADACCIAAENPAGAVSFTRPHRYLTASERAANPVRLLAAATVRRDTRPGVGLVRGGGFAGETPLLARYPGSCPAELQGTVRLENLIVVDQGELNRLVGQEFAAQNGVTVYAEVVDETAVVPGEACEVDGARIEAEKIEYSIRSGALCLAITGLEEPPILIGETETVPPAPTPDPSQPPAPPRPPTIPPKPSPRPPAMAYMKAVIRWGDQYLAICRDIRQSPPTWYNVVVPGISPPDGVLYLRAASITYGGSGKVRLWVILHHPSSGEYYLEYIDDLENAFVGEPASLSGPMLSVNRIRGETGRETVRGIHSLITFPGYPNRVMVGIQDGIVNELPDFVAVGYTQDGGLNWSYQMLPYHHWYDPHAVLFRVPKINQVYIQVRAYVWTERWFVQNTPGGPIAGPYNFTPNTRTETEYFVKAWQSGSGGAVTYRAGATSTGTEMTPIYCEEMNFSTLVIEDRLDGLKPGIHTNPITGLWMNYSYPNQMMALREPDPSPTPKRAEVMYTSDSGGSWTMRSYLTSLDFDLDPGVGPFARLLGWQANAREFVMYSVYQVSYPGGPPPTDRRIYYSADGGYTWVDKTSNFHSVSRWQGQWLMSGVIIVPRYGWNQ